MNWTDKITVTNEDNMELMARYPDNYFDLAIVDPPYGLGSRTTEGGCGKNSNTRWSTHQWDNETPTDTYFIELKRVSKNQIIWGGNYFKLHSYRTFIVWDKDIHVPTMSRVELAYTSFDKPAKLIKEISINKNRIHVCQKPVKLYEWLLMSYAKEGDKILDTHLGSGSIAIAAHNLGFELTGCELDKDYYEAALKRFKDVTSQTKMF